MLDLDGCAKVYERCQFFEEIVLLGDFCRDVEKGIPPAGELSFRRCYSASRSTRRVTGYATSMGQKSAELEHAKEASPENATPSRGPLPKHAAKGFFTEAVLEGLRGKATPHPITGTIDIGRLKKYVDEKVKSGPASGRSQTSPRTTGASSSPTTRSQSIPSICSCRRAFPSRSS